MATDSNEPNHRYHTRQERIIRLVLARTDFWCGDIPKEYLSQMEQQTNWYERVNLGIMDWLMMRHEFLKWFIEI